jgi:hypothetical protein
MRSHEIPAKSDLFVIPPEMCPFAGEIPLNRKHTGKETEIFRKLFPKGFCFDAVSWWPLYSETTVA